MSETNPTPQETREDNESPEDDNTKEQKARSELREKFLTSLKSIYNKPAKFYLHEMTNVTAVFRATDIDFENLIVSDLQTPIGPLPEAILRATDVLSFEVDLKEPTK